MEAPQEGGVRDLPEEGEFLLMPDKIVVLSEQDTEMDATAIKSANFRHHINFRVVKLLQKKNMREKVGLFESHTRSGRAVQAVGSYFLPGDTSSIRSPIRSAVWQGLTPGGSGGGGGSRIGGAIGRAAQALRCPVGFEFGGRYATRGFGNCGRQLFETPGPADDILNGSRAKPNVPDFGLIGLISADGRRVTGLNGNSRTVQIQRAAQIPRVGGARQKERDSAVEKISATIGNLSEPRSFMVRQDGYSLKPSVNPEVLRTVRRNPDMNGAVFVVNAPDPNKMGEAELPLIWAVNAQAVRVALPDNNYIEVSRSGNLTAGDKRKLTRRWATIGQQQGDLNYGEKLRALVDASDGSLTYKEKFGKDKANEMVRIVDENGAQRSVRRWVFNTYLSSDAPRRGKNRAWKEVGSAADSTAADDKIDTLEKATEKLRAGGLLEEVPSKFVDGAIRKSAAFKRTKLRDGVEKLERPDGTTYYQLTTDKEFGAIAARVGADVRTQLGLAPATVKFAGNGDKRSIIYSGPENISGGKVNRNRSLASLGPDQIARLAIADWLTDQSDRSPGKLTPVTSVNKPSLFAAPDFGGGLAGLSKEELDARRREVLGDFFKPNNIYAQAMAEITPAKKKTVVSQLESLLKQAEAFKWADYRTRLGLDGDLSAAEKAHLDILNKMYEQRLSALRQSRKMFLRVIGLG